MRGMTLMAGLIASGLAAALVLAHDGPAHDGPSTCPMHAAHQAASHADAKDHHAQVDQRHDEATGVVHTDSVHHFVIEPRGGTIRLEVTDPADTSGRDRIRAHLAKIATDFTQGRFDLPMLVHDQVPPGVETMQRLRTEIRYRFAPTPRGGRVEITTGNADARAAIHEFLRFQIDEHRTGDPR